MNELKTTNCAREYIVFWRKFHLWQKCYTFTPFESRNVFAGNLGAYEFGKVERFFGGARRVFIVIAICPDSYERGNNGKKNSKQSPQKLPNDPQTPIKRGGGQNHTFPYKHFK